MRKILFYLSFCLLLFSSFPVYAAEVEPLRGEAVITSDKLNVRSGPSKEYSILGTLERNQVVEVTGIAESNWYVIEYNNSQGYIYGDYLIFTPLQEVEEETTAHLFPMRTYVILGLSVVILLVVGLLIFTFISMQRDEGDEEEGIPVTPHEDTNMHLGEVTYDTYRLDIDPSFFETTTLVPQPESVEDNEKVDAISQPEESDRTKGKESVNIHLIDTRLEEASAQLAALQKEVEELKKQKQEED